MEHQNNVQSLFKVKNKDTRTTSLMSFRRLYYKLWTDYTHRFSVLIIDFEQVNAYWEVFFLKSFSPEH